MFKKCFVLSVFTTALMFAQAPSATNFGGQPGAIL
jgi:hypothetical protein